MLKHLLNLIYYHNYLYMFLYNIYIFIAYCIIIYTFRRKGFNVIYERDRLHCDCLVDLEGAK